MKEESSKEPTIFLAPVSIDDGGTNNKSCRDFANQANSSQVTMSEWLNVDEWKDKFTAIKKKVAGSESTAKELLKKESGKEKDPKKNKSKEKRKKKHSSKEKKKSKKKEAKSKTRKEKHRGKTNNDKKKKDEVTPVLSYEEESAAMDLESLKRKPWFEKEDTEKEKEQDLLKDWDHADDEWCSESEDDQSSVEIKEDYRDFLDIFEKNINKDSQDQGKTKAVKEERNTLPQSPRKNKEQQVIDLCDELSEKVPP